MAGEGAGTSLYMMALLKDTHHDPKFGPFEAKKYEGSSGLFLSPALSLPKYSPPHILREDSIDRLVGNYTPVLADSPSTYSKSFTRPPTYLTNKASIGCYH
ncbi:hypothetical protein HZA99_02725 [Candidatus Woesearchaeota archaeon]|nr:hypothetical protein [Candidatus Woesearchaeota archaeon]